MLKIYEIIESEFIVVICQFNIKITLNYYMYEEKLAYILFRQSVQDNTA